MNILLPYFETRDFIFRFEGHTWTDIVARFRLNNIIISGGSNTKKHILSPVQFRLSQFLLCYYGPYFGGVSNSFSYIGSDPYSRPKFDFTDKKVKNLIDENKRKT
jgi:hypothetical protein